MSSPEEQFLAEQAMMEQAALEEQALAEQAEAEAAAAEAERARMLDIFAEQINIADGLDEEVLTEIGAAVIDGYDIDKNSRSDWEEVNRQSLELARQISKQKILNGTVLANVKHPLIATAIMQFHARAYPNIIKGREIVKPRVIGRDEGGKKIARATRAATYVNYQLLEEIPDWEEGMDQLLMILPLVGSVFKKTFGDQYGNVESPFILAEDLVVNYWAKSLEKATRISHKIYLTPNEIIERERSNTFLTVKYDESVGDPEDENNKTDGTDKDADHVFIEQHRWWDLDDDGYQEPYIVTVHKDTGKVVRITARFTSDDLHRNEKDEIEKIDPIHYFTHYRLMPSMDGAFYGTGFGVLLSPITSTINTTINQLLDAGTAQIRGGGFMGKSLRLGKGGTITIEQGKWKQIPHSGDDLRKNMVPYPVPEPSTVLFQLLGLMITGGKELASMADVLSGQDPPSDQPATTTLALIEQGLKVFTAVYKRIHRSERGELSKIYRLNYLYATDEQIQNVVDDSGASRQDFESASKDVVPVSDQGDLTDVQRLVKAQALLPMKQGYNDVEIDKRYYEALGIPDYDKLLPPEGYQPPEDPKITVEKAQVAVDAERVKLERDKFEHEKQIANEKALNLRADSIKKLADAEAAELGTQLEEMTQRVEIISGELENVAQIAQVYEDYINGVNQGELGELEGAPGNGGGMGNVPQISGAENTGVMGQGV